MSNKLDLLDLVVDLVHDEPVVQAAPPGEARRQAVRQAIRDVFPEYSADVDEQLDLLLGRRYRVTVNPWV